MQPNTTRLGISRACLAISIGLTLASFGVQTLSATPDLESPLPEIVVDEDALRQLPVAVPLGPNAGFLVLRNSNIPGELLAETVATQGELPAGVRVLAGQAVRAEARKPSEIKEPGKLTLPTVHTPRKLAVDLMTQESGADLDSLRKQFRDFVDQGLFLDAAQIAERYLELAPGSEIGLRMLDQSQLAVEITQLPTEVVENSEFGTKKVAYRAFKPTAPAGELASVPSEIHWETTAKAKISFAFQQLGPTQLADFFSLALGVPVRLEESVADDFSLTLRLRDVCVADALRKSLENYGLGYAVFDDEVVIADARELAAVVKGVGKRPREIWPEQRR